MGSGKTGKGIAKNPLLAGLFRKTYRVPKA